MPTWYLLGDSTVDDNQKPFRGWGYALPEFTAEHVLVRNLGASGHSSKSFLDTGLFREADQNMHPGDLLMIQFGHNDEKDDAARHTDPESTFPEHLKIYLDSARARGALPILCTPVSRRFFTGDGSILYTHGAYPQAIRKLAETEQVILCDLENLTRRLYLDLGEEKTAELFVRLRPGEHPDFPDGHDDKTHFNAYGARCVAELAVKDLRRHEELRPWLKQ